MEEEDIVSSDEKGQSEISSPIKALADQVVFTRDASGVIKGDGSSPKPSDKDGNRFVFRSSDPEEKSAKQVELL